jgi:hypothetical protein
MRLVVLLTFAGIAFADIRLVTKITRNGRGEPVHTDYYQGAKYRSEWKDASNYRATIFNPNKAIYQLDLNLHQYTEGNWPSPPLPSQVAKPPETSQLFALNESTPKVYIDRETIDTGGRREFFGQTAQHLILRERRVPEPGSCYVASTSEREGWYFPLTALPDPKRFAAYLLVGKAFPEEGTTSDYGWAANGLNGGVKQRCRPKFVSTGRFPAVFAVVETTHPAKNLTVTREILELSDAPLDPTVFEAPPGFTKVKAFPEPKMSPVHVEQPGWWESLKRAVWSWFS